VSKRVENVGQVGFLQVSFSLLSLYISSKPHPYCVHEHKEKIVGLRPQACSQQQPASHLIPIQLLSLHANALKRMFLSAQNRLFLL